MVVVTTIVGRYAAWWLSQLLLGGIQRGGYHNYCWAVSSVVVVTTIVGISDNI